MLEQLDTLIGFVVVMSVVSLLITVVTQIAVDALALRGLQLRRALGDIFHALGAPGTQLAEEVVSHRMVSERAFAKLFGFFKWWSYSVALRPEELYRLIEDVSKNGGRQAKAQAGAILKKIHQPSKRRTERIKDLQESIPHLAGEAHVSAREKITELKDELATGVDNLAAWFHTAQERAQQRFATQTHTVAVIAALIAAFVLQLDVFETLRRVSVDKDLRDHLVANSTAFSKQAEEVLSASNPGNARLHAEVLRFLEKKYPDFVSQARNSPAFADKHETLDWMRQHLANPDQAKTSDFLEAYEKEFDRQAAIRLDRWRERLGMISEQWSKSSLSLQPHWPTRWTWGRSHLCGMLAAAALLSLGAPYWFNILKSLTNLRPIVARQVDENPASAGTQSG